MGIWVYVEKTTDAYKRHTRVYKGIGVGCVTFTPSNQNPFKFTIKERFPVQILPKLRRLHTGDFLIREKHKLN